MPENSPSHVFLGLSFWLLITNYLRSTSIVDDSAWKSTPNVSPFDRFLSDQRSLVCPMYEEKECETINNKTSVTRKSKLNDRVSRRTAGGTLKAEVPGTMKDVKEKIEEGGAKYAVEKKKVDSLASEQPPIVTFDEWTKEKLKKEEIRKAGQQQSHQHKNIHLDIGEVTTMDSSTSRSSKVTNDVKKLVSPDVISQEAAARNYASKECGAKVLFSNEEAENKNGVLDEKEADNYMRNPCERAEHKWLIIELCETIQVTVLEVANFELFSSGPQKIRLSGSERYPANEWLELGEFMAENNREIQRFPVTGRSYVKFIRLELLTHYGHEHYCTLSLVRILGISMVDEYEAEAEAAAAISGTSFSYVLEETVVNNNTGANDHGGPASTATNSSDGDILEVIEISEKNESISEIPIVDAVVNAVGSIGIGNIKGVFESRFLKTSSGEMPQKTFTSRRHGFMAELCTQCFVDTSNDYLLFCRAFFGLRYSAATDDNMDEQISHTHSSVIKPNQKEKKNSSLSAELFLAFVLSTHICDLEAESQDIVEQFVTTSSGETLTVSSTTHIPTSSGIINAKSGGGFMLPGGALSHKESIFLKLNKRISALELNMSLSSEYLSELSRRYVLQTNESRRQADLIIKQAEEAAINAVRLTIDTLKSQMDTFAVNLRELTEIVKSLPEKYSVAQRTVMLRQVRSNGANLDSSLARPQGHFPGYQGLWTTGELIFIVVFVNILMLFILLLLHYSFTCASRDAIERVVNDRLEKLIQESTDARSLGDGKIKGMKLVSYEPRSMHQTTLKVPSASCNVVGLEITPVKVPRSSSLEQLCSLTENEVPIKSVLSLPESMELAVQSSSQLSTCSGETQPIRNRKKKKKSWMEECKFEPITRS